MLGREQARSTPRRRPIREGDHDTCSGQVFRLRVSRFGPGLPGSALCGTRPVAHVEPGAHTRYGGASAAGLVWGGWHTLPHFPFQTDAGQHGVDAAAVTLSGDTVAGSGEGSKGKTHGPSHMAHGTSEKPPGPH